MTKSHARGKYICKAFVFHKKYYHKNFLDSQYCKNGLFKLSVDREFPFKEPPFTNKLVDESGK